VQGTVCRSVAAGIESVAMREPRRGRDQSRSAEGRDRLAGNAMKPLDLLAELADLLGDAGLLTHERKAGRAFPELFVPPVFAELVALRRELGLVRLEEAGGRRRGVSSRRSALTRSSRSQAPVPHLSLRTRRSLPIGIFSLDRSAASRGGARRRDADGRATGL